MATNIPLTPEQKEWLARVQAEVAAETEEDAPSAVSDGAPFYWKLMKAVAQLRAARVAAGLTVEQLAERTGLPADDLARLEAGRLPNPTWGLLGRYAVAVGRSLGLTVGPPPERSPTAPQPPITARTPDPQPQP